MATNPQIRRPPPAFRRAEVTGRESIAERLTRVTLAGSAVIGIDEPQPAGSVRVLLPPTPGAELELPEWTGNEFLAADGTRPNIRTVTPIHLDPTTGEFELWIVLHGHGPLSRWAQTAAAGDEVAISGPARGVVVDDGWSNAVILGDESAIPAITQLIAALPAGAEASVFIEAAPGARPALASTPGVDLTWLDPAPSGLPGAQLLAALEPIALSDDQKVWCAGEAAMVAAARRLLLTERGIGRDRAVLRGYWKLTEPG